MRLLKKNTSGINNGSTKELIGVDVYLDGELDVHITGLPTLRVDTTYRNTILDGKNIEHQDVFSKKNYRTTGYVGLDDE
tara:strand:+ start:109 stop:345 length:237 start_codon:yes stop_codon:yes gene_type:complete